MIGMSSLIAMRPIPLLVIEQLRSRQNSLTCLQCMSAPGVHQLFANLRELSITYPDTTPITQDLQNTRDYGKHIQRLDLTCDDMRRLPDPVDFTPQKALPHLKQLSLSGIDIWFGGHLLFDLFDFFALTHLDLSGCRDQSFHV